MLVQRILRRKTRKGGKLCSFQMSFGCEVSLPLAPRFKSYGGKRRRDKGLEQQICCEVARLLAPPNKVGALGFEPRPFAHEAK